MLLIVILLLVVLVLLLPPLALQLALRLLAPPTRDGSLSVVRDEDVGDGQVVDPREPTFHHREVKQPSARLIG